MSLKERLLKDTLIYSIANYIAMAIGIFMSIAAKFVLGPLGAGYWAIMKVFLSYAGLSDFGSKDAMLREVSQATGAGEQDRARKIRNSSFCFSILSAVVFGAIVFIGALFFAKEPTLKYGLFIVAFLVIATQYYNFSITLLRVLKRIPLLSFIIITNICFVTIFSLGGAYFWGILGFVGGTLAATFLSAFLAHYLAGIELGLDWDWSEIWKLIKIGLPLVIMGYAIDTFLSVDAIMIGKMLGLQQLGLYTIALMSVQQINSLGRFSQIILVPHVQEKYGRSKTLEDSKQIFIRTTHILIFILPVIIGMVFFAVPLVVHYFIPKFEGGISSMKILVLGYFFIAVNELSTTILFTINRQKDLIPIFVVITLLAVGLNFLFIRQGYGIEGVAVATAISYFIFFMIVFSYSFKFILSNDELLKMIGLVCFIFVYFTTSILLIEKSVIFYQEIVNALVKMTLFVLALLPLLVYFEKKEKFFQTILSIFSMKARRLFYE